MFEHLQKKLASSSEWLRANNVWDVLVYGSAARGKRNIRDIDVALILEQKITVDGKLRLAQEMRKIFAVENVVFDVKVVEIYDLQDPGFLARAGILAEGYSLIRKDYIAERFGFLPTVFVSYSLKGLTLSKQKILYYALQGRKRATGVLAKLGGRIIAKGMLTIPTKNFEEIKELLEQHKVNYVPEFSLTYRGPALP